MATYFYINDRGKRLSGFTLIELSIVLVIIGLIVGGVLVGQDLIRAATVRAQITQIEKYNTAVNTFYGKFSALPGDMNYNTAAQFGFNTTGRGAAGQGDGNGVLEGGGTGGLFQGCGETAMFWSDLSNTIAGNLIDGAFNTARESTVISPYNNAGPRGTQINLYFPEAKLGQGNYIYVWSGGINAATSPDNKNYYGILPITWISCAGSCPCSPPMSSGSDNIMVMQAYSIDKKMDDGFPQTGNVTAMQAGDGDSGDGIATWASGGYDQFGASPGTAAAASSSTCYDNGGNASSPMTYSLGYNNGAGRNCAISFKFQ